MKRTELKRKTPLKARSQLKTKSPLKVQAPLKKKASKSKHRSNPVPTADDLCILCGKPYAHTHEVFYGTSNRKQSYDHKLQVRLCYDHHEGPAGVHGIHGAVLSATIKHKVQEQFEQNHTREQFMDIIGRNYILDV